MTQCMKSKINQEMSEDREHAGASLGLKGEAEESSNGHLYYEHLLCARCQDRKKIRQPLPSRSPQSKRQSVSFIGGYRTVSMGSGRPLECHARDFFHLEGQG